MMENKILNNCRVCGYDYGSPPWGNDGDTPSFEICPCCGVEFGYGDFTIEAIRRSRSIWIIEKNAKWAMPEFLPKDWNFFEQIKNVPKEWI